MSQEIIIKTLDPHPYQKRFVDSKVKRIVVKAGRRSGKTAGVSIKGVDAFMDGKRVLYAAPTSEQTEKFWYEVKRALANAVQAGVYKQNESEQFIERPGTENRIKAKTAWNANTLRGDYADLLILDEFQLMTEDAWDEVGAPMLADNNGDAVFIFTPPSLKSSGVSKAQDPRHASKLFTKAQSDVTGLWEAIHFTSFENPFISHEALGLIALDMSKQAYRQEILAEDDELELSWLVYKAFNETLCRISRFDIPKTWPVYSGHDFGSANPAALFFAKVRLPLPPGAPQYMRLNDLVAFREYRPSGGLSIQSHIDAWEELTSGYRVEKSIGGNVTTEDETRQGYTMAGWPIQAPSITRVNAQLDRVVGAMEQNKVFIFNDLYSYLEELMNCLWLPDRYGKPSDKIKDEQRYHLCAAARTLLSDFMPDTVSQNVSEKKPVIQYFN